MLKLNGCYNSIILNHKKSIQLNLTNMITFSRKHSITKPYTSIQNSQSIILANANIISISVRLIFNLGEETNICIL